ncbi:gamma-glutamylcyclotransferase family protein [uncultured Algibacter sp.]|uniref:gamma-glutamylcyclotransferase family protein n=1 Tax=uncultured Algibacter sp. TaxID=298659 RepID=UPI00261ADE62|nr:gamma-glutamylcyclotransferase family protein [uncultured Algibacter sp.]
MITEYLFVYGTLQHDAKNNMSQFLCLNSNVLGKGYIYGRLYKISWFPGVILSTDTSEKVYGTLFKLHTTSEILHFLDEYEGFIDSNIEESLFRREITTVFLENGNSIDAWVYIYNQNIENKQRILSGDFLKDAKN